jgi:hypothetical protein
MKTLTDEAKSKQNRRSPETPIQMHDDEANYNGLEAALTSP